MDAVDRRVASKVERTKQGFVAASWVAQTGTTPQPAEDRRNHGDAREEYGDHTDSHMDVVLDPARH